MVKRMLIDATHAEETRVVVLNGSRLEEFDVETSTKRQLKGNIYLAKIIRVEPSLQAAFVDYGGGRHGFLAFNEIHPDYYQIPVADRQALIAEHRAAMRASGAAASADFDDADGDDHHAHGPSHAKSEASDENGTSAAGDSQGGASDSEMRADAAEHSERHDGDHDDADRHDHHPESESHDNEPAQAAGGASASDHDDHHDHHEDHHHEDDHPDEAGTALSEAGAGESGEHGEDGHVEDAHAESQTEDHAGHDQVDSDGVPHTVAAAMPVVQIAAPVETVDVGGGDDAEEVEEVARRRHRPLRHYKIQEVIKRRQIVLVQVVKEERGTKGAALTTYLSLAGRYCVLMPNTARGGGVSRKITNATDRKRLKTIVNELEIPDGMAVIIRTAGSERTKPEIKRDYEYLLRLWDSVRELTLQSTAPAVVYEEANLIKRSIRDLYARDIDEILVEGDEGYRLAKDFMRMLTPSHAKKVQLYKDPAIPMLHRFQVETQLDAMHSPNVQLKSGGYIVMNQTEALVAIDVNSGRATRERHIEETAYKTNLEAADEIARQLRLRDLAGLIVIDFIDMEESRNNHAVERRIKDAMRLDRARIQLGRISPFGLLELSRQRLRPSLMESSFQTCTHCGGTGSVRSIESSSVHILRVIEEEGIRRRGGEIRVTVHTQIALYLLNQKRAALFDIEGRYLMRVLVAGDDTLIPPTHRIERLKTEIPPELLARPVHMETGLIEQPAETDPEIAEEADETEETALDDSDTSEERPREVRPRQDDRPRDGRPAAQGEARHGEDGDGTRRRRRRRRRGRRDGVGQPIDGATGSPSPASTAEHDAHHEPDQDHQEHEDAGAAGPAPASTPGSAPAADGELGARRRRRGKRGGRRRNRGRDGAPGTPMAAGGESFGPEANHENEGYAPDTAPDDANDSGESFGPHQPADRQGADQGNGAHHRDEPEAVHETVHEEPRREMRTIETARPVEQPPAPLPPAPVAKPEPTPAPEPEPPAGPPRRGWWNRVI